MTTDSVRRDLRESAPTTGLFVHLFAPPVIELAGKLGVELAVLDMEHTAATTETIEEMVLAARGVDLTTIVRVPGTDSDTVRRVLDGGADGVLLPRVTDADDVVRRTDAAFFAPIGRRGSCSLTRAADFTLAESTHQRRNEETIVAGLVELASAVDDVDAIVGTDRLDLVVLGPGDLAQSMGHADEFHHREVVEALETVIERAHAADVPVAAYAVSPADAETWVDRGADVVLYSDVRLFRGALEAVVP